MVPSSKAAAASGPVAAGSGAESAAPGSDEPALSAGEDPHSLGLDGFGALVLGPLIALATVVVPLAMVISSGQHAVVKPPPPSHGPEHAGRLTLTGVGQSGGGDPRR